MKTNTTRLIVIFYILTETKTNHADKTELGERQSLTGSDRESSPLLAEKENKNHMNKRNKSLDEELDKNEKQLIGVTKIIETLKNHKEALKDQKKRVSEIFAEILEKEVKTEEKKWFNKKKEIKMRRTAARDEILTNTEKLMETTEEMIITMTEMKVRLEEDQKQVNKQLKEEKRLDPDENRAVREWGRKTNDAESLFMSHIIEWGKNYVWISLPTRKKNNPFYY